MSLNGPLHCEAVAAPLVLLNGALACNYWSICPGAAILPVIRAQFIKLPQKPRGHL